MDDLKRLAIVKLEERGVLINELVPIVYNLQIKYCSNLTYEECLNAISNILSKREVIYAVLTGIAIDKATEQNKMDYTINNIINNDDSLYGIDEILALSIVNVYGSIALTTFGYLDKTKPGIIGILDEMGKKKDVCNTFLDDIVAAIVAAAASKIAHKK